MRKLIVPNIDMRAFYLECANDTRNADRRARLNATVDAVVDAADAYAVASDAKLWCDLPDSIQIVPATDEELKGLYDRTVVGADRAGRYIYDKIFSSSSVCPMCGQGKISSLDHYLPKSKYAQFAILPINLVPSCRDCNTEKLVSAPSTAADQSFHPYFDDVENDRWLYARVTLGDGISIAFFVDAPQHWPLVLAERAQAHFVNFKLDALFATFAGTELSSIKYRLQKMFEEAGAGGVKADLAIEAESARIAHLNSWKTAMYEVLSESDEFCGGGFEAIGV